MIKMTVFEKYVILTKMKFNIFVLNGLEDA